MVHTGKLAVEYQPILLQIISQNIENIQSKKKISRWTSARLSNMQKSVHPIRKYEKTYARAYKIKTIGVSNFKTKTK